MYYVRIGNRSLTQEEVKILTPNDINDIKADAERAENIRKDNIAASMGFQKPTRIVADVRPGSELAKAIIEDKAAAVAILEPPVEVKTEEVDEELIEKGKKAKGKK